MGKEPSRREKGPRGTEKDAKQARRKMTALTFTIDVPDSKIEELREALGRLDIQFQPERQIIAFEESLMETCVAMGHHTPDLVQEINRQLTKAGLTPPVPTDHETWPMTRRMAFLEFAISHFDWVDHDLDNSWWRTEGRNWDQVVAENPLVFEGAGS